MRFTENLPRWFLKKHQKNLDAVAQAARLCDSIHVFRLLYGSGYLLVRAATHIHNDFPKPRGRPRGIVYAAIGDVYSYSSWLLFSSW